MRRILTTQFAACFLVGGLLVALAYSCHWAGLQRARMETHVEIATLLLELDSLQTVTARQQHQMRLYQLRTLYALDHAARGNQRPYLELMADETCAKYAMPPHYRELGLQLAARKK